MGKNFDALIFGLNICFLYTSKLSDGTSGTPRKTGLAVYRNQIFVAQGFSASTTAFALGVSSAAPPLLQRSLSPCRSSQTKDATSLQAPASDVKDNIFRTNSTSSAKW